MPAWKQEISERLVAHRSRRTRNPEAQPVLPGMESAASRPGAAQSVAARVAERYARVPSYREVLAAEAANAARAAEAAAKAAQKAHEAAQAMNEVLWAELDDPAMELEPSPEPVPEPAPPIRYHVDPGSLPEPRRSAIPQQAVAPANRRGAEIVDPFEDAVVAPAQPLPVRILEFPRELVAARKARPRHAEGPLREEPSAPEKSQLRIFEVEADAISREAAASKPVEDRVLPEWHSIRLDARPSGGSAVAGPAPATTRAGQRNAEGSQGNGKTEPSQPTTRGSGERGNGEAGRDPSPLGHSPLLDLMPLHVASMEDRLMAGIVDLALVLIAFLLFVLVFVACTAHPPTGKTALAYASVALVSISALYQWIFFSYAHGTPGMRYAKIALCTFDDENPTRRAMQWRVAALFLSAVPVGLGFLWAFFDEDGLGWHDRITRTYQRSYR
jgi:uncharacterized RDD family membrane protein YckC